MRADTVLGAQRWLAAPVAYAGASASRSTPTPAPFALALFAEHAEGIGTAPSRGTVAGSVDNALAATTNGLHKAEFVCGPDADG